jgi:thioredoxin 2
MNIVCHQCATVNRVPSERMQDNPVCGKCKTTLLPGHPIILNDNNFNRFITSTELPIVVDFWAEWCGPCKMMAPQFLQAAQQMPQIFFVKMDTEANPRTSAAHFIRSIPTLILFHNGKEIAKQSGAMQARDLTHWINIALEKSK